MPLQDFLDADLGDLFAIYDNYAAGAFIESAGEVTQWNDLSGNDRHATTVGSNDPDLSASNPFPTTTGNGDMFTSSTTSRHRFTPVANDLESFTLYYWGPMNVAATANQSKITIVRSTSVPIAAFGLALGNNPNTRRVIAKEVGVSTWQTIAPDIDTGPTVYGGNIDSFEAWVIRRTYDPAGSTWRVIGVAANGSDDCHTWDTTFTEDPGQISDTITQTGLTNSATGTKGGAALYTTAHSDDLMDSLLMAAVENRGGQPESCAAAVFSVVPQPVDPVTPGSSTTPEGDGNEVTTDTTTPLYTAAEAQALAAERVTLRWELDDEIQTVRLGGVDYRLRTKYNSRTKGWYIDLYSSDGEPIALGRRLSPRWGPTFGIRPSIATPAGVLIVSGPDDYVREDLGNTLFLTLYPTAGLKEIS